MGESLEFFATEDCRNSFSPCKIGTDRFLNIEGIGECGTLEEKWNRDKRSAMILMNGDAGSKDQMAYSYSS